MAGFLDTSHFLSTFRKLEVITPHQYRDTINVYSVSDSREAR
jgi:AraC-like DNA-binding protein